MKKTLTVLITFFFFYITYAQDFTLEKPDYSRIESAIKIPNSNLYYPTLEEKFKKADSTMTIEEKRHLYFGFIFQKKYNFNYDSKENSDLAIIKKKETVVEADYNKIISLCEAVLNKNPFDLEALNLQKNVYEKKGDVINFRQNLTKMKIVIDAIMSTGKGTTKESAIYLINIQHEFDITHIFGFEIDESKQNKDDFGVIKLKENDRKIVELYFDASPHLKKYTDFINDTSFTKDDLIGVWKVTETSKVSGKNKDFLQFVEDLKTVTFTFTDKGVFHLKTPKKTKATNEILGFLGTSNWIFNPKEKSVSVGSKSDNYTMMKIYIIKQQGNIFFYLGDEGEMPTMLVEKI